MAALGQGGGVPRSGLENEGTRRGTQGDVVSTGLVSWEWTLTAGRLQSVPCGMYGGSPGDSPLRGLSLVQVPRLVSPEEVY